MHEENRERGVVDHRLRDPTKHELARAGMPKASKHQQICLQVTRNLQQL